MKKIKNKIKNFDKEKIKSKVKNIDTKKIKDRVRNIKKDDVKTYYKGHKNTINTIILLPILIIVFLYTISFGIDIKNKYNQIQTNMDNIKIVQNKNIIQQIKNNNLRSIDVLSQTAFVINDNYDNEEYKKSLNKLILILMYNSDNHKSKINDELFLNKNGIDLIDSDSEKIDIILNIDKLNYLVEKYEQDIVRSLISNKENFTTSSYINSYLSSLAGKKINIPGNYQNNFDSGMLKTIKSVLNNIYIYELVFIQDSLEKDNKNYEEIYNSYKYPYETFLAHILLPSINIWENKFSKKINVDIFGSKYLSQARYIDLNLVKYWSDYFESSYKGKFYQGEKNRIDHMSVGKFSTKDQDDIANLSMQLKFGLNNDKSFYGLVSKLTSTSNEKNIMIVTEFTYYLWKNTKDNISNIITSYEEQLKKDNINYEKNTSIGKKYISSLIYRCIYEEDSFDKINCSKLLACENEALCSQKDFTSQAILSYKDKVRSYNMGNNFYNSLKTELIDNPNYQFYNSFVYNYFFNSYNTISDINTLIGARLYDCLIKDDYCTDLFMKSDDEFSVIKKTIIEFSGCDQDENIDTRCKYNFIDKFDTNYFIAYTMVDRLEENIDYTYVDRLKDIYKNMSGLLKVGEFTFKKDDNNYNNTTNIDYTSTSSLQVYYDYLSNEEFENILTYIGEEECTSITNGKKWTIDIAYTYTEGIINNLYKSNVGAGGVYDLNKILSILEGLRLNYDKKSNLEKTLANIQAYRILKEASYCY